MSSRVVSAQSSSSRQTWPGRSHIAVFVRCLHLLDLDLLEDWPGVTEQIFTTKAAQQNLQLRIKAVEWSLYRLCELYDPHETKDKLRPFFPPTTSLQSLNLRAALYRYLTELKKNGVLDKDVLLRKTMLDDCKGDRFEEVIASLAMAVLRKKRRSVSGLPTSHLSVDHLLPTILAYRNSLQSNLRSREDIQTKTKQQQERLREVEVNLQERLENAQKTIVKWDPEQRKRVQVLVNSSWIGDHAWAEILLKGVPVEDMLKVESTPDAVSDASTSLSLLRNLDDRIREHQSRLAEWRVIAKDLANKSGPQDKTATTEMVAAKVPRLARFDKHKHLALGDWKLTELKSPVAETAYTGLIDAMRRELRTSRTSTIKVPKARQASVPTQPQPIPEAEPDISDVDESRVTSEDQRSNSESKEVVTNTTSPADYEQNSIASDRPQSWVSQVSERSVLEDSPGWIPDRQTVTTLPQQDYSNLESESSPLESKLSEAALDSPSSMWMSLADRTRASMSADNRQSILPEPGSHMSQTVRSVNDNNSNITPDLQFSSDDEQPSTLLERTRKSMSLFAHKSDFSSRSSRRRSRNSDKRLSQVYPINQFETPGKREPHSNYLSVSAEGGGRGGRDSGSATPRDKLFDEDAEYDSVFKSRPKLALSPAFGAARSSPSAGFDSILGGRGEIDHLGLESDVD